MGARPVPIIAEKCHYCSKYRHPHEVMRLPGGVRMCWHCHEWHGKAMMALATGVPPPGCQNCGVSVADLKDERGDGNVQMCIHVKDGVYQVLCKPCSAVYATKRRDLFGKTVWGRNNL